MSRRPLLVAWAWLALSASVAAQSPSPSDAIRVTPLTREGQVYVSFVLADAFSEAIRETIQSGLPTSFAYDFELRRIVPLWVDRTIAVTTVVATVQYDNLTRRHQLSRSVDGRVEAAQVTEDAAAVEQWMTRFERLALFTTAELEPNGEYYVRVRARARPRSTWSLLPWDRGGAWGHARFTFIP
jgi:hypothetical protein